MGGMTYASYDGGLNNGQMYQQRGQHLNPSTRSRSMGQYGGYSDTEVMVPTHDQRYYDPAAMPPAASGRGHIGYGGHASQQQPPMGMAQGGSGNFDPYYENTRAQQQPPRQMDPSGGYAGGGPLEDRRAQPPPPPPRNVNFEGDPPIKPAGGPRGAPTLGRHYGESDMESVTSALSSHSAPHQRPRRPGLVSFFLNNYSKT